MLPAQSGAIRGEDHPTQHQGADYRQPGRDDGVGGTPARVHFLQRGTHFFHAKAGCGLGQCLSLVGPLRPGFGHYFL